MAITEVTSQSWISRLVGSIKSVLLGMAFFFLSFPLLFWNEGRAVRTAKSLTEGAGMVRSVSADQVDAANEGALVHMTSQATTTETLADPDLGIAANALKLDRRVEMYQWEETKKSDTRKKLGGGTETVTTYDYKTAWSSRSEDSGRFKEPRGHENPGAFPIDSRTVRARSITVGGFSLSDPLVNKLGAAEELRADDKDLAKVAPALRGRAKVNNGTFYLGANPSSPAVGDVRVTFKVARPMAVSLVARQVGSTFEPYHASAGDDVLLLKPGTMSADAMFAGAQAENATMTWIIRGLGYLLMAFGLRMIFNPLVVLGDVIPLIGTLLGAGLGFFSAWAAAIFTLVTIAVSWIFFRPLLGIALLALAATGVVLLVRKAMSAKARRTAAHPVLA